MWAGVIFGRGGAVRERVIACARWMFRLFINRRVFWGGLVAGSGFRMGLEGVLLLRIGIELWVSEVRGAWVIGRGGRWES